MRVRLTQFVSFNVDADKLVAPRAAESAEVKRPPIDFRKVQFGGDRE